MLGLVYDLISKQLHLFSCCLIKLTSVISLKNSSFISDLNIYSSLVACNKVLLAIFSIFEYLIKRCKSQLWGFLLDIFNMELCSDTKNQYKTNCKNIESCFSLNLTIFMYFGSFIYDIPSDWHKIFVWLFDRYNSLRVFNKDIKEKIFTIFKQLII